MQYIGLFLMNCEVMARGSSLSNDFIWTFHSRDVVVEEDGWASKWRLSEGVKECTISRVFFPGVW